MEHLGGRAAFADVTFDETAIITDSYSAAYGGSPYAAMGSWAGFEVDLAMETSNVVADDYGLVNIVVAQPDRRRQIRPEAI